MRALLRSFVTHRLCLQWTTAEAAQAAASTRLRTLLRQHRATPLTAGNPYPMPFLMPPAAFADRAFAAIQAGASYRVIPWQMGLVAKLLRALPNALYDRLLAGRGRKPRWFSEALAKGKVPEDMAI